MLYLCIYRFLFFSFLGCYMHGCYKCFAQNSPGPSGFKHYETRDRGKIRLKLLRAHPQIKKVTVVWGCDFDAKNPEIQKVVEDYKRQHGVPKTMDLREGFRGGITEVFAVRASSDKLVETWKAKYPKDQHRIKPEMADMCLVDINSSYCKSFYNKYDKLF